MKKQLFVAGGILLGILAVNAGNLARQKVDTGSYMPTIRVVDHDNAVQGMDLTASKGNEAEETITRYYDAIVELLEQKYVDPVKDEHVFVDGAVKGMVASLNDPNCFYMNPAQYKAFMNARKGQYEGIGADMVLELSPEDRNTVGALANGTMTAEDITDVVRIPRVVVAWVVPGGPADQAGIRPGDWVDTIDQNWVINSDVLKKLRRMQQQVQKGKAKMTDLNDLRKRIRDLSKLSILPSRAWERLTLGTKGAVDVKWRRGDQVLNTKITKGESSAPIFAVSKDGSIRVQFLTGQAQELKKAIAGKSAVTLDLRGNVIGDIGAVKECISVVAKPGTYGYLVREKGTKSEPLKVLTGNAKPPKVTLLVDSRTRNAAEIFALALSSRGSAKLSGEAMANDRSVTEVVELPNGTGYTLVRAKYQAQSNAATTPAKKVTK